MKVPKVGALVVAALVACMGGAHVPAQAQDYPSRPLTMVVPFTPGAATDFLARLLGKELEERLGKPVVVENRPGAGTNIGSHSVAKAAPEPAPRRNIITPSRNRASRSSSPLRTSPPTPGSSG